jgi:hypothetical protein
VLASIPIITVNAAGDDGMPILPHGMGAFYNLIGSAVGTVTSTDYWGYGEYMAYKGEIIAAAVNISTDANFPPGGAFTILAANYSQAPSAVNNKEIVTVTGGGVGIHGSATMNFSTNTQTTDPGTGLSFGAPGLTSSIPFGVGDYIGIWVKGPSTTPSGISVAIEGTLYLNI